MKHQQNNGGPATDQEFDDVCCNLQKQKSVKRERKWINRVQPQPKVSKNESTVRELMTCAALLLQSLSSLCQQIHFQSGQIKYIGNLDKIKCNLDNSCLTFLLPKIVNNTAKVYLNLSFVQVSYYVMFRFIFSFL